MLQLNCGCQGKTSIESLWDSDLAKSESYALLEPKARAKWGRGWLVKLADAAGMPPASLRTQLSRGKRLPPADVLDALLRAIGVTPEILEDHPKAIHELAEFQDARTFTSLVEAIRRLEELGGRDYVLAWRGVAFAAELARTLSGWTDADYGDTVLGGNTSAMMCGYSFFGADHMVFSTDYALYGHRFWGRGGDERYRGNEYNE